MPENDAPSSGATESQYENSVSGGFALWLFLLFATGAVLALSSFATKGGWMLIVLLQPGIWQVLFVVPAVIVLRRKRRFETVKGLLISAAGLFILNVLCTGSLILGFRR